MINRKAKGSKGERELVRYFNENHYSCLRAAGSGSSIYPCPDVLAGNAIRRLAIECKVTKEKKKYFQNAEIEQLLTFSRNFGAESWIGVKFPDQDWYFVMPEDMKNAGKCKLITLELAQRRGLNKEELLHISDENRKL